MVDIKPVMNDEEDVNVLGDMEIVVHCSKKLVMSY